LYAFSLLLGGFVIIYISYFCIKSLLFYCNCMTSERTGAFVECKGVISELIEEKKKAMCGELVSISYPCYRTVYEDKELVYHSVVSRINVCVGQSVSLFFNNKKRLLWAKGDLILLRNQITKRILSICAIVIMLAITLFL